MALWSGSANATCPNGLTTTSCNNICTVTGTTFACDTDHAGSTTQGATAWIVTNYSASMVSAWGTDNTGATFCCEYSASAISIASLTGSDTASDVLSFNWQQYDLTNASGYTLAGTINGLDGDDTLIGSNSTSASYSEALNANDGCDTVFGGAGGESIYGGNSDCWSGLSGPDDLHGESGDDAIYGEGGKDNLYGGPGDDILWGGAGPDLICGEDGDDTLSGLGGLDTLWGGNGADTNNGGAENDSCGSAMMDYFCEVPLYSNPGCDN
jgi:hypothetical protein